MFSLEFKNNEVFVALEGNYLKLRLDMISSVCSDPIIQAALEQIVADIESVESELELLKNDKIVPYPSEPSRG